MTLDHLAIFIAIARHGGLSAAARKLGKAQSTVSTALANLEADLGVRLFDRDLHQVALTAEGEVLLGFAQATLNAAATLERKAYSLAGGRGHRLRLGIDPILPQAAVHLLCLELEQRFPELQLELLQPNSADAAALLKHGALDICVAATVEATPVEFGATTLGHVQFVPVAARNHPLAALKAVSNRDLAQVRQLRAADRDAEGGSVFGRYTEIMWHIENQAQLVDLVKKGLGWAFIPEHLLADERNRDLCVLPHEYQRSAFLKAVDLLWSLRSRQTDVIAWLNGDLARLRTLFALR
ncbi:MULTISPECIES: LysR family transcriptional regulator [Burkholderia]|uniref:LysR family transcriptional regulator n=1 Tax=Burkholderia TaxID=32008 RepID=UPI000BF85C1E|nr:MULTISPECIES: LysR family transcriptional regulator [Burkholderia]PFH20128.1 LysR family transcriptional regulator [Burkholderia sp. JKS000303]